MKLSRTVSRARAPVGLGSLPTEINRSTPRGGLTAVTLTRSTVRSTTPAPRMPLTPVACTVSPRITTGARVVIATAVVGAPGGSTTTDPLSPPTDSSVRPLPMTIASAYVPGSTSTVPPSPTMSIPS